MNIAYLTNVHTNTGDSGGSVHVSQVAKGLMKRGHKLYSNLQNESENCVQFTVKDFFKRGKEIDIFYVRIDGWPERDNLTLLRKANPFSPCIWEINAPHEEMRLSGMAEEALQKMSKNRKELAKMVEVAICVSDEMEAYAKKDLKIKKTFVIPNGSDPELFSPEKRDKNIFDMTKYKVLWAGSPKYIWQGIKKVQELANKLKENHIDEVLIVVTAEGESSDNILYLGHVPYSEMPRYMASVDLGLCMYEDIDFYKQFYFSPLKLYDYMASGLPVIGSNVGQIKSVIEENQNGLLVDNSIHDLIEKIMFLKANPGIAASMGNRGRKAVMDKYNWDSIVLQTESIVLEAMKNRSMCFNTYPHYKITAIRNLNRLKFNIAYCSRNLLRGMKNKLRQIAINPLKGYH